MVRSYCGQCSFGHPFRLDKETVLWVRVLLRYTSPLLRVENQRGVPPFLTWCVDCEVKKVHDRLFNRRLSELNLLYSGL